MVLAVGNSGLCGVSDIGDGAAQIAGERLASPLSDSLCCPAGQHGWSRLVTDQLFDQFTPPNPYKRSGPVMTDTILIAVPSPLGITGTITGSLSSDANGS